MKLNLEPMGVSVDQLRASANSPEAHAAAILAAKDYVLSVAGKDSAVDSAALVQTIALHAALLMQTYLGMVTSDDLGKQMALAKFLPEK
jgi:hypothetical protein